MDDATKKFIEQANGHRLVKEELLGPSDAIARNIEKIRMSQAALGTTVTSIIEKIGLTQEALGTSSITAAMEAASLAWPEFADSSKLLNERVMVAFGPALGSSSLAKAIEAVSRPLVDEETLRILERAQSSFYSAFKHPDLAEFQRIHEQMIPPGVAQQLDTYALKFKESLGGISAAIAEKVALFNSFSSSLASLPEYDSLFKGISGIADTFASVEWQAIGERLAKVPEGEKALDDAGYSFTKERWELSFFIKLADAEPDTRERIADELLLNYTQAQKFTTELFSYINGAVTLQKRSRIIERAIRAHQEGDYLTSIPLLFIQIEGVVSDFLLLKKCATHLNGKMYRLDSSGSPQVDRKGKLMEFIGLHSKADHLATIAADDEIQAVAEHITNTVAPERNPILHGADIEYDSAKRGTQAALVLLILCSVVYDVEKAATN